MNPNDPQDLLEQLDPELERLFSVERGRPAPSGEALERVFSRVQSSIALSPLLDADASPPATTEPSGAGDLGVEPKVPSELTGAATSAATGASSSAATGLFAAGSKWLLAGVFAAGAATGAASHSALERPPEVQVREVVRYMERPIPPKSSLPSTPPAIESDDPEQQVPKAPTQDRSKAATTSTASSREEPNQGLNRDAELADENRLIERAQTALGRRDPEAALVALRLHRSRYPEGQLSFERELLEREATRLKDSAPRGSGVTEAPQE